VPIPSRARKQAIRHVALKAARLRMMRRLLLIATVLASSLSAANYLMYVGTYTGKGSKGIYAFRFDPAAGKFQDLGLAVATQNPSFLAVHPNGRFLYAVNEISHFQRMEHSGAISSFSIDPATAKLRLLNTQGSLGDGPCHLTLDKQGKSLIVANYNNGSIAAYPVAPDGLLNDSASFFQHNGSGAIPHRQDGPHAHCVLLSPDQRFALVADLGLDEVLVYHFDAARASLTANDPPFIKVAPGAGPRHLAFHPNGRFVYLINEVGSTIDTFAYDAQKGALRDLQTISTVPADYKGQNDTAEIEVHPNGKFVYGSNRGRDSIAVFAVDPKAGTLKAVEDVPTQGKTPRNFAIDPTGTYLLAANQQSNNIVVFKIDSATGRLTPTGEVLQAPSPVCLTFVPVN
jgi:6-phosphogluconolactonase